MGAELAISLLLGLLDRATQIGALLDKARKENRDITSAELDDLVAKDDAAKAALDKAIADAKAAGH